MNTTTNRTSRAWALFLSTALTILNLSSSPAQSADVPLCVKFVGSTSLIRNDSNAAQKYCDAEGDVFAVTTGGLGFTTEYRKGPRKVWVDLKSAAQLDGTSVDPAKLPRGEFEMTFHALRHNTADGVADTDAGGCLPTVNQVLALAPGDWLITAPQISFVDNSGTASKGDYRIRFGQPICEPGFSWNLSSDCPLKLTAGYDFNNDGLIDPAEANLDSSTDGSVDIWTIEPLHASARAHLLKVNKRQQFDSVGFFELPFKLVFTKQQLGTVLNSIN